MRRSSIDTDRRLGWAVLAGLALAFPANAPAQEKVVRLGMIGLDTSHAVAFTGYLNNPKNNTGCKVVAAFPGGSPDFKASADRVGKFTAELRDKHGVEMVASVEELCRKVDGVLLESVDGRPHLAQAKPVIAAGLPLFVDKPVAADLAGVVEIFRLAKAEVVVGPWLEVDPQREQIAGSGDVVSRANALLRGQYRAPFVVPENV